MLILCRLRIKAWVFIASAFFLISCAGAPVKNKAPKAYPPAVQTMNKGAQWYNKGCYERAVQFFWEAHEQFSAADLPEGVAASFNAIGNASHRLGETDNSVLFLNQAWNIYEQLKMPQRQINVLTDMAAVYLTVDKLNAAKEKIEQAEKMSQEKGVTAIQLSLIKGILLTRTKNFDQARKVLLSGLDLIDTDDFDSKGSFNAALGHLESETDNIEAALTYFNAALDADRQSGFYIGMAENLFEIGQIYADKADLPTSLFYLERSLKIYALLGLQDKTVLLEKQIASQADATGKDVRLTLNLAKRWLRGEVHHHLCQ